MSSPLGEQFATVIVGPWPGSRQSHERNIERISGLSGYLASGTGNPDINAAFVVRYPAAEFSPDRNRMEWRLSHPAAKYTAIHTLGGATEIYDRSDTLVDTIQHETLMPDPPQVRSHFLAWVRSHSKRPG